VGACDGSPGTRALLAQGAAWIEQADDVIAALEGQPRRPPVELPAPGSDAAFTLGALDGTTPRALDEVARLTGMGITRIAVALCALELEGLALPVPGGSYVRSAQVEVVMET
jgi:predicted Rossmann fold nucleotide-binding protein DprA/Smf involved in DNA uptake